ncbi:MAG TPA: chromosomal replication initiator protein DnaA [Rhodothermales bacterium]|nr:chromosomal replication initiator protein DnaA [Rhodothermales bacterium]HRR09552.1 chromosomal replication initiator protein DnaA [Rhodothermales bacterium]
MLDAAHHIWQECLTIIRDNVDKRSYKTWFEPIKPLRLEETPNDRTLTIQVPSRFYYEWLEEHYASLLRKTVTKVMGPSSRLIYDILMERDRPEEKSRHIRLPAKPAGRVTNPPIHQRPYPHGLQQQANLQQSSVPPQTGTGGGTTPHTPHPVNPPPNLSSPFVIPGIRSPKVDSQLNGNYTFDRFIEGDCNRLARSAAWAIAERPSETSFNPFLVYGGVGLGKTHLIQAIGNYAKQHQKIDSILYISSERFTNEFVQSIQYNRVSEFSLFYRQIDLLIVDDIQFFGKKEKTQEEFFHIFNALHQAGKQIILSADRPPKDIVGIEERLLSRFQWGLTADVQPPDLETRIAILQRKAEDDGIQISYDIIEFIAHNITSNIRELEGALIRLLAHSTLRREEIDLSFAKEVLKDLIKEVKVSLGIEEILQIVSHYFQIPEDQVRAKTRKQEVVQARQVAMYFAKQFTKHSLKTIGLHFGGRDHSTVIHGIQSVEGYMETDPKFADTIREIQHKIKIQSRS